MNYLVHSGDILILISKSSYKAKNWSISAIYDRKLHFNFDDPQVALSWPCLEPNEVKEPHWSFQNDITSSVSTVSENQAQLTGLIACVTAAMSARSPSSVGRERVSSKLSIIFSASQTWTLPESQLQSSPHLNPSPAYLENNNSKHSMLRPMAWNKLALSCRHDNRASLLRFHRAPVSPEVGGTQPTTSVMDSTTNEKVVASGTSASFFRQGAKFFFFSLQVFMKWIVPPWLSEDDSEGESLWKSPWPWH